MKTLALETLYILQVIDENTGRKTPGMQMTLQALLSSHEEAIQSLENQDKDKHIDPFVNILYQVNSDEQADWTYVDCPLLRMSTLSELVKFESEYAQ